MSVRLNDGAGTFGGTQNVAVGAAPYTVTTGDLDGDGDLDLVVPNYSANTLAVRLNDGLGIFSGSGTVATGTNPIHAVLGDVDGDGDLDAAITNYTSGTVSIRLNQAAVAAPTLTSVAPTSGPVGTPVTLTGTSLTGATGVSFGGIALTGSSFTVVNATTLTLNVPAGAATGSVTVTTAGGTTAAQTFTVTVVTGLALAADANVAGLPGAQVLVPVRATGFSGLMGLQGSLTFDASQLTYVGVEGFAFADLDAGDFGAAQAATGTLTLAWANSQAVAPAALAAGAQLFAVRFTVNAAAAGSTALTLPITLAASPLAWQAVRSDYSLLTPTLTNGSVAVAAGVVVSGTVLTSGGAAVAGATVRASGPTVARPTTTTAAGTGAWSLSVPGTGAYVVAPRKTNDVNLTNGLSVLDVLLIQRHVLASPLLGNAYKVIAADVDSSGTVTVADVAQVRDLLLGTRTSFGATGAPGRLWRFVASSQTFANANSPWPIQTSRSYASVSAQAAQNFVGCKLGDVSGDWNPALPRPAAPLSAVALRTDAATVVPGGRVRVAVRTAQTVTLTGAQATLTWNPAVLRLVVARPAPATGAGSSAALTPTFGLTRTAQGELRVIWTATDAQAHPLAGGAAVVELEFEGIGLPGATTALALAAAAGTNGELAPVATDDALALHPLTLAGAPITLDRVSGMAPDQAAGLHLTLWPNPAHETVRITGVSAAPVQLLDGVGRVVRSVTATDAGAATLDVRGLAAGVYVVRSGARTQRLVVE